MNVIADLGLAQLMAAGRVRGDWELALAFSVVPVMRRDNDGAQPVDVGGGDPAAAPGQ